jgi:hypothetical protein
VKEENRAKEKAKGKAKVTGASVGSVKILKGVIHISYYFPQCLFFS